MSEHEPRAYVHCHAYGCQMLGCMTRSTSGTNEWLCFLHFAAEPDDWQAITAEVNRLDWLVKVIKTVRLNQMNANVNAWVPPVNKEIKLAQRSDLCWNGVESMGKWSMRLEKVLSDSCRAVLNPPTQATIPEAG